MPLKTITSEIVDQLESGSAIATYLEASLEDGDPKLVAAARGGWRHGQGSSRGLPMRVMCKDATAKCYGGDISHNGKLLTK